MKQIAEILLDLEAVKVKMDPPFTWTSGIKAPVYCDNRVLISFVKERDRIIEALIQKMEEENLKPDFLAGTATAGIPWASFLADRLKLPMVFVRNAPKGHGTKKQIEGRMPEGSKVLIIEDLISTAKSSMITVDAVENEGQCEVLGVLAVMSWQLPAIKENFDSKQVKHWTLTDFSELIPMAEEKGYINKEQIDLVMKFKENPAQWGENL